MLNLDQSINCPPRKPYNPHLNLTGEEKQTFATSFEQAAERMWKAVESSIHFSAWNVFFFTNHIPLNLSSLCWGEEKGWMPRATITAVGWEWVGAWLLPQVLAADLLGCGSVPPIHYPNGLGHSQQPRTRAAEPPQKGSLYPLRGPWPHPHPLASSSVSGTKKSVAKSGSSFRINVYPLGLTST